MRSTLMRLGMIERRDVVLVVRREQCRTWCDEARLEMECEMGSTSDDAGEAASSSSKSSRTTEVLPAHSSM